MSVYFDARDLDEDSPTLFQCERCGAPAGSKCVTSSGRVSDDAHSIRKIDSLIRSLRRWRSLSREERLMRIGEELIRRIGWDPLKSEVAGRSSSLKILEASRRRALASVRSRRATTEDP